MTQLAHRSVETRLRILPRVFEDDDDLAETPVFTRTQTALELLQVAAIDCGRSPADPELLDDLSMDVVFEDEESSLPPPPISAVRPKLPRAAPAEAARPSLRGVHFALAVVVASTLRRSPSVPSRCGSGPIYGRTPASSRAGQRPPLERQRRRSRPGFRPTHDGETLRCRSDTEGIAAAMRRGRSRSYKKSRVSG
jgi:hypothetical protein